MAKNKTSSSSGAGLVVRDEDAAILAFVMPYYFALQCRNQVHPRYLTAGLATNEDERGKEVPLFEKVELLAHR